MNLKELANRLGVAPFTASQYLKQAKIPAHRVGRYLVIDESEYIRIRDEVQRHRLMLTRREARELLALIGSRRDLAEVATRLRRIGE